MRISDWSSDVCSSDLGLKHAAVLASTSVAVFFVYRRNRIGSGYGLYAHQSELRRQSVQFVASDWHRSCPEQLPAPEEPDPQFTCGKLRPHIAITLDIGPCCAIQGASLC